MVAANAISIAFGPTKCNTGGVVTRRFWHQRIAAAWQRRSIVWLMGVRRAGKTMLAQSLPDAGGAEEHPAADASAEPDRSAL